MKTLTQQWTVIGTMLAGFQGSATAQAGALDAGFDPGIGFDSYVTALAVQPNGKILTGGWYVMYNGQVRNHIARLQGNGTLDLSFGPGANDAIEAIALEPLGGKIIVGGAFQYIGGEFYKRIARLNSDGSVDPTFFPGQGGFNDHVNALAIQPDGRIIAAGYFTTYRGNARSCIARLNSDGTIDPSFDPGTGFAGGNIMTHVRKIALQPDGRVVAVGEFTSFNGTPCNRIARLNADGSFDASFNTGTGADQYVAAVVLRSDGRLVFAGDFTQYNGTPMNRILQVDAYGAIDPAFSIGTGFNNGVGHLVLQPDGRLIAAGVFATYNGTSRVRMARLNTNGSLDASFDPGAGFNGTISSLALQPNGRVLVGGNFTQYNGVDRIRIARLLNPCVVGASCDDGSATTTGDVYGADCVCSGAAALPCIPSQLTTTPDPIVSCGATDLLLDGSEVLWADEVPGAGTYQFRFTNVAGQPAYARNIAGSTRALTLKKWATLPLKAGRSYEVKVRTSFDGGHTWCPYGAMCTIAISGAALDQAHYAFGEAEPEGPVAELFPVPSDGGPVHLTVSGLDGTLTSARLLLSDALGRPVFATDVPAQNGMVDQVVDLPVGLSDGLYVLTVQSGVHRSSLRLVISR